MVADRLPADVRDGVQSDLAASGSRVVAAPQCGQRMGGFVARERQQEGHVPQAPKGQHLRVHKRPSLANQPGWPTKREVPDG